MAVLGRLLLLIVLLLLGLALRHVGALDEPRTDRLSDLAYYVALPALVFVSTHERRVASLLSPTFLVGIVLVLATTALLAWGVHRNHDADGRRSVAVVQSYHSNLGYLGLPLVAAAFGPDVTAVASVVLGVASLIQVPLTVFVLVTLNGSETQVGREVRRIAANPVLLALVAGLVVGSTALTVPSGLVTTLDLLGALALPVALLCVGSSLQIDRSATDLDLTARVAALKLGCMPAIAWVVFSLLGVDAATFVAGVVMFGMPTAVSTFVFADELGGDEQFASINVFATTLVSTASIFVLVSVVG